MKHGRREEATGFGIQFVSGCICTTLVLLLLGGVLVCVSSAHRLSAYVRENITFTLLMDDNLRENEIRLLQQRLNRLPFVKESEYVSKEQALREHSEMMGTTPADFLGYNPFRASIEVKLRAEYANADSIAGIEQALRLDNNVREVSYRKELLEAVNRNLRRVSLCLLAGAGALALVSFALIASSIRLSVYSQRFLIHTMKLVGASRDFIRRPFLCRYCLMGLLSACLADAVLLGGAGWLAVRQPDLARVLSPQDTLAVAVAIVACGVLMTGLCAWLSVGKYLRLRGDALYRI